MNCGHHWLKNWGVDYIEIWQSLLSEDKYNILFKNTKFMKGTTDNAFQMKISIIFFLNLKSYDSYYWLRV